MPGLFVDAPDEADIAAGSHQLTLQGSPLGAAQSCDAGDAVGNVVLKGLRRGAEGLLAAA
jgi:hypothetical protein